MPRCCRSCSPPNRLLPAWSDALGYSPTATESERGAFASNWIVVGHTRADLAAFERKAAWHRARVRPSVPLWTDDYSSLLRLWMPG